MRAHEAERAIISLVIRQPDLADEIDLKEEQFGEIHWRRLWTHCNELRKAGKTIDEVTLLDCVSDVLVQHVAAAATSPASEANLDAYISSIKDAHLSRQVLSMAEKVSIRAKGMTGEELAGYALSLISQIDEDAQGRGHLMAELVRMRMRELDDLLKRSEEGEDVHTGLPTGIDKLDAELGGLQRGIATVVAARPGMGKSSFAMGVAEHLSERGIGVHVFSLEDTREAYTDRALSRKALIPAQAIRQLQFTRGALANLTRARDTIHSNRHWYVDDSSGLPAEDLIRQVRRRRKELGTQCVVVDYLQLMAWPKGCTSRYEAVTRNINALADAAKQDRMAYVVLSQLSRSLESRENKRPLLSDLKESGAIEERAKCVLMLYRGSEYGDQQCPPNSIDILVRKNSHGENSLTVRAVWDGPTTRIY